MSLINISWIIFSYLLGSFPSGFLISRFSGKDILKIGWRKTSGSNVFREVGFWQGALTGILDVLKGFLAVFLAQKLGFPLEVQIFSGVAAVTGHNWSCFLKFSGGRGIGTFIGAFFALAPKVLGFSLIPFVLLALIWNAAIGTLLFLVSAILISIYFGQFEIAGLFTLLTLAPVFIKRLSPIGEIKKSPNRLALIRNRLIFDNDQALLDLRIKKVSRFFLAPFILPPKVAIKLAKIGAKLVQEPLKKLLLPEKVITEIGIAELKNLMIASAKKIVIHQEEINKINVFPVADRDTGYNLAATLLGIEGVISQKEYNSILELTQDIKEGAIINARGNAGMIYTGYLIRVLDEIRNLDSVNGLRLAWAMRKGTKAAYRAIANPVEGTILDVIKVAGEKTYQTAKRKKEKNIIKILEEAYEVSQQALAETKEKLEVLKKNDVVDAGALGFVKILEAWIESLKGLTLVPEARVISPAPSLVEEQYSPTKKEEKLEYQYELVFSFKKSPKLDLEKLKNELSLLGGSIDIIDLEGRTKIHIHTNFPEKIREKIKDFEILEWRVEDMAQQVTRITEKKALGLVVGETADLPREFLEKHQIEVVPFKINFPDETKIPGKTLYEKMRKAKKLPTTSAPNFGDYLTCYKKALEKFEKILVITLPSRLSGAYSQARIARSVFKKPEKLRISIFDCFTAEVAEGLVVIRVQELISQGKKLKGVLEELKKFCPKVKLLGCLENLRYLVHGGRLKLPKILIPAVSLAQKIGIQFLFGLKDGKVRFLGIRFGKNLAKILTEEVEKQREQKEIRVAIAQADNLKAAQELRKRLEKKPKTKVLFISSVSPVIGVHTGPGTLIVAFHPV